MLGGGGDEMTTSSGESEREAAATLNELTLAMERLARTGDIDLLNMTRRAYAAALGVEPAADLDEVGEETEVSMRTIPEPPRRPVNGESV